MGFSQAPGLPYSKLGIPEDGDAASKAISKGKYVIWKGKNYFAKTDILQGETFVEDTNLTEIPDGALNGIVDALNSKETYETNNMLIEKYGHIVAVTVKDTASVSGTIIDSIPAQFQKDTTEDWYGVALGIVWNGGSYVSCIIRISGSTHTLNISDIMGGAMSGIQLGYLSPKTIIYFID